jgi:hypothetical protein
MRSSLRTSLSVLLVLPAPLLAQTPTLQITLEHGSEAEARTRDQLLRLVREHDVSPWLFTRYIRIDERQIPHSHPVLTLHTRHLGDDMHLLSTFIHEQFHWFVSDREAQRDSAIAELRLKWPEVPVSGGTGARDEFSTYLHLIVCDMEFQGMERLVGRERAAATLDGITHYTWIYDRVLNDPAVREINRRWGFIVP